MEYSAIFNECCKECVMFNPKKCRFNVALLWSGIGFFTFNIILLFVYCLLSIRIRRSY
uniref:p7 protein n=1 Tax=Sweet potato chlorotic stunt virus TaxID=81931 RepID=L7N8X0_9CLOS|nr:p7 protein [Sweet potato chlorotic stunt virus]ADQ42563.1 p7 protein [Sweet potato chlorotic stunt virus]ADQ42567.1 p7 protein [Sweet potato chlorotic stunt virus]ADQ42607.1 p7 protein [Sweet potato chlorotic stunt virus]